MFVADMDFEVASPIVGAMDEFVDGGDFGYTRPAEEAAITEAAVEWMSARHGWRPNPSWAVVTRDVMQGVALAIDRFTSPGDRIVLTTPVYPPFFAAVESAGRRVSRIDHRADGSLDWEELDRIADGATALLLCNPHNPTGRVFTPQELAWLGEVAVRRDLTVISDEVHADLVYDGHRHHPIAALDESVSRRTVTVTSPSKAFNVAGIAAAVMLLGSEEAAGQARSAAEGMVGHARAVNARVTTTAWTRCDDWLDQALAVLHQRRAQVCEWARGHGVGLTRPQGTYLAWLDFRRWSDRPVPELLERARVALREGEAFGGEPGFARLNFATSHAVLAEALSRIGEAMERS